MDNYQSYLTILLANDVSSYIQFKVLYVGDSNLIVCSNKIIKKSFFAKKS